MWTPTTRQHHNRPVTRYQTDLTDAEWRVIAPHLPKPCATGRPRQWPMREIVNGIFYVMRAGCPWRLLPNDLPPWGTIYRWFAAWRDDGRFERINHALVMADRERVGRDASPSAAIIDSQSVKTTEAGGPRGYDAAKKLNGRKRHALVDTDGRGLVLEPHPASIQDRDGGAPVLQVSRRFFPFIQRVFADSGYAGEKVAKATLIAVEIVRKNADQVGFAINPRRWVVERFFAWIGDWLHCANGWTSSGTRRWTPMAKRSRELRGGDDEPNRHAGSGAQERARQRPARARLRGVHRRHRRLVAEIASHRRF
jgi:transposase